MDGTVEPDVAVPRRAFAEETGESKELEAALPVGVAFFVQPFRERPIQVVVDEALDQVVVLDGSFNEPFSVFRLIRRRISSLPGSPKAIFCCGSYDPAPSPILWSFHLCYLWVPPRETVKFEYTTIPYR